MSQQEIEQIELSITEARKIVERGQMAEKLERNREFQKLVLDGYFTEEAARLVHLSSDPTLREDIRNAVMRDMAGIGGFKRYLSTIIQMGKMAAHEIAEHTDTLEEIREEELYTTGGEE